MTEDDRLKDLLLGLFVEFTGGPPIDTQLQKIDELFTVIIADWRSRCAVDTSDIPEATEEWFAKAKLKLPPGHILVPLSAIEWLFGAAPDPATGKWFGENEDELRPRERAGKYWWRSKFRSMIPALAPQKK